MKTSRPAVVAAAVLVAVILMAATLFWRQSPSVPLVPASSQTQGESMAVEKRPPNRNRSDLLVPEARDSHEGTMDGASQTPADPESLGPLASAVFVPDERVWLALPFPDRILTPRSVEDAKWMQSVGYPTESDIKQAPNLENPLDIHDLPMRVQNAVLVREIRAGNPRWRKMAAGLRTRNVFAARLVFEDLMIYERYGGSRTGGRFWLDEMSEAAMYALVLGDTGVNQVLGWDNRRIRVERWHLEGLSNNLANMQRFNGGCPPIIIRPYPPPRP